MFYLTRDTEERYADSYDVFEGRPFKEDNGNYGDGRESLRLARLCRDAFHRLVKVAPHLRKGQCVEIKEIKFILAKPRKRRSK